MRAGFCSHHADFAVAYRLRVGTANDGRTNRCFGEFQLRNTVLRYYDMKQILAKEDVAKAIDAIVAQGKKPTLALVHAALGHRGSMSTLVRLRAELDGESQTERDFQEGLKPFRELWALAVNEGSKHQAAIVADLQDTVKALAAENERLDGVVIAAQDTMLKLEEAKSGAEARFDEFKIRAEVEIHQTTKALKDSSNPGRRSAPSTGGSTGRPRAPGCCIACRIENRSPTSTRT
jgi:hypothetical protein